MNTYLGKKVYHKDIYDGKEIMEIVGIRKDTVELEGTIQEVLTRFVKKIG